MIAKEPTPKGPVFANSLEGNTMPSEEGKDVLSPDLA